jgi:hypothetical protein
MGKIYIILSINMASEAIYSVLDTLIGEIADLFHSYRYIHTGGANMASWDQPENVEISSLRRDFRPWWNESGIYNGPCRRMNSRWHYTG